MSNKLSIDIRESEDFENSWFIEILDSNNKVLMWEHINNIKLGTITVIDRFMTKYPKMRLEALNALYDAIKWEEC